MDVPTSFFSLEKKTVNRKILCHLKLPGGGEVTDGRIRSCALSFYEDLYKAEPCDDEMADILLQDLPQLMEEEKSRLDQPLTFDELTVAVQELSSGKVPGLDGLNAEFYKKFWSVIGKDLFSVLECRERGTLPVSLRRAVITLLPKKGDLGDIKNWRPVSLLGVDYKIFSKALINRLKLCISSVIHADQSYCIPNRSIFDNLFLVRDLISFAKVYKLDVGLVSLDQEKAFDRVDHGFLFKCLNAFGFGSSFISYVKLLYTDVYSILKINGTLLRPFLVGRGIRQGCGLSGILYAIVIEPLLTVLRRQLSGISIVCPYSTDLVTARLSAYADDVTVVIRSDEDVKKLVSSLDVYQRASSSRINWQKSVSFLLGKWENGGPPVLPRLCSWSLEGFKVLGVFMGVDQYMENNWEGIFDKVSGRLQRWRWILPQLSYRGRVLIINNLAASMLWHRLNVLNPPKILLQRLQKIFVDFFWDGHHWLPPAILYLPVNEGGQGLIDVNAKVKAMRLKVAQTLLYSKEHTTPWVSFGLALLR
uniref:Reverse transcriptase domain-containing protein n=1 Tax=Hucho hucho TaxID=62062 RepID=A0A4W5KWL2_9TELE